MREGQLAQKNTLLCLPISIPSAIGVIFEEMSSVKFVLIIKEGWDFQDGWRTITEDLGSKLPQKSSPFTKLEMIKYPIYDLLLLLF